MPHAQPLTTGDPPALGGYELLGRLGEGGQGVVYLATRPGAAERYAFKLLHGQLGRDHAVFLREVELAKQVARFCTAQLLDAGLVDGRPYIVSEFVDGPSLQRDVTLAGPRSGGALERLAVGTATALTAIHRAGIAHRDLKPQNVLLGPDGPRVIDFGLARALATEATLTGRGVGTPAYMAPEQITADELTAAVDVFAWGSMMCFAANGHPPFGQDSIAAVLHRILTAPPELGRLGGRLGDLVRHCLDKNPRNRPGSGELLLALLGDGTGDHAFPTAVETGDHRPSAVGGAMPSPSSSWPFPDAAGRSGPPGWHAPAARHLPASPGLSSSSGPQGQSGRTGRSDSSGPWDQSGSSGAFGASGAAASGAPFRGAETSGAPVSSGAFGAAWGGSHAASGSSGATPADESAGGSGLIWLSGPPDAPDTAGERQPGLRTQPMPPATRASMAMSGSLLISAAILVGVLVPAIASGDRQETPPQAHPGSSAPAPAGVAPEAERSGGSVAESVPATSAPPKVGRVTGLRKAGDGGRVPAITGLDRAAAVQRIEKAGFVVGAVTEVDSTEAVGKVLRVWPAPGSMAELGSRIDLEVSAGVKVPALAGLTRRQAESALAAAGLAPGDVTSRCLAMPDGQVLSSRPAAGRRVAPGTGVALVVARHGAVVPAVVGRSQAEARQALRAAGFTVRAQARIVPPGEQAGVALAQAVAAGTCAAPGRTVTIVVGVEGTADPGPGDPGPDPSDPTPGATADPGGITGVGDDATT